MRHIEADSHSILNTCKNYFCQLLNVSCINDVMQTEMHTTKPLVLHPSYLRLKLLLTSLKDTNLPVMNKFWQN